MQWLRLLRCRPSRRAFDRAPAAGRRRAFTIIELVIVILITSVLAAITAPAFMDSLVFHRVESAARRVKADIEYQRQRARLTSTAQAITFSNGAYTLTGAKSLNHPARTYAVDLKESPYSIDTTTVNFSNTQAIAFDGYGTPSSGGTIILTAKNHQCTVTVNGTTGSAAISSNHASGGSTTTVSN